MDGGSTEIPDITSMEDLGCLENKNPSFIITTIIWSFILLLSFLLNATLLLAFIKRPGLRTISNRFVMNLSASNLLTISLLHPLLITDQSAPSAVHCTVAEGATALVTTSSIFSVLLIAIDQYLAVIDPLHYRTRIDNLKCTLLIIVVWLFSIIISILAIFNTINNINSNSPSNQQSLWQNCRSALPTTESSLPTADNSVLSTSDTSSWSTLSIYNVTYTAIYIIIIYLAPFIAIIWIYICIYTAAHNNSERTRRTGSRPILTVTNYLTDDDYLPLRHDTDFSRIKNISSLSSIDESIEITSQLQRHLSPSPIIEEDINYINNNSDINQDDINGTHVIFTVGSQFDTKEITEYSRKNDKNTRPYGVKDVKRRLEEPSNHLEENGGQYGTQNGGNSLPYSGHIGDYGVKDIKGRLKDPSDDLEENGGQYGTENGGNSLPYSGHIGDYGVKDVKRRLEEPSDDLEENGGQYGTQNAGNSLPYIGHISDYGVKIDKNCLDEETGVQYGTENCHTKPYGSSDLTPNGENLKDRPYEDENGKYGKLPYIGHIGQNGKLYGIDEVEECSDEVAKNLNQNGGYRPYIGHIRQNGGKYGIDLPYMGQNGDHYRDSNEYCEQDRPYGKDESDGQDGGHVTQNGGLMPPKVNTRQNTRTANYINSLRHRISNGSLFKYREETRAARISALVIVMGFICWTPFFTIVVIKSLAVNFVYHEIDVVGVGCFLLGTIVSPMLFGYRSRRVKRELRKLFCFRRELAYKNNRSLMAKKVLKRRNSSSWGVDGLGDKGSKLSGGFWNFYRGKIKEPGKVQFVHVPETALTVDTCRSSFSSGASTQISSTSTDDS